MGGLTLRLMRNTLAPSQRGTGERAVAGYDGEWHIEELDGRWALTARPHVSWRAFVPQSGSKLIPLLLEDGASLYILLGALAVSFAAVAVPGLPIWVRIPAAVAGPLLWWFLSPPAVIRQAREASRPIRAVFGEDSFETQDGMFDTALLPSIRLEEVEEFPGRFRVAFVGSALKDASIIGWPGLPKEMAHDVLDAVVSRSGVVDEGANKRFERAPQALS